MRSVTGIELGAEWCVLARVRPGDGAPRVSSVHGLQGDAWQPDDALSDYLRNARRTRKLPRRARVVAWGLHESASARDAATKAALGPVADAGFAIETVVSPPEALALLAGQRPRAAGREGTAWLALNRHAAAIAIVQGGELLFSRVFDWNYRPAATTRAELLQKYSLIAHLALELRHGFDVVRSERGIKIDGIVTCGDLPDLRSLTMPLIEELDIEVETLDSLDGLEVVPPAKAQELADVAPALRLACAVAAGKPVVEADRSRLWIAAAAVALLALLVWGAMHFAGYANGAAVGPPALAGRTAPDVTVPPAAPVRTPAAKPVPAAPSTMQPQSDDASRQAAEATVPAATMGRQAPPLPVERARPPAATPDRTSRRRDTAASSVERRAAPEPILTRRHTAGPAAPVPLKDPLPVVNSILVSPERRLAVVDGAIVHEGEAVGPRVLIRIEPGALLLREPSGYEVRVPIRPKVGTPTGRESGM
jgi:hypothetical protein